MYYLDRNYKKLVHLAVEYPFLPEHFGLVACETMENQKMAINKKISPRSADALSIHEATSHA